MHASMRLCATLAAQRFAADASAITIESAGAMHGSVDTVARDMAAAAALYDDMTRNRRLIEPGSTRGNHFI